MRTIEEAALAPASAAGAPVAYSQAYSRSAARTPGGRRLARDHRRVNRFPLPLGKAFMLALVGGERPKGKERPRGGPCDQGSSTWASVSTLDRQLRVRRARVQVRESGRGSCLERPVADAVSSSSYGPSVEVCIRPGSG